MNTFYFDFGSDRNKSERLIKLVTEQKKTATTGLYKEGMNLPIPGDTGIIKDGDGEDRCAIKYLSVEVKPFKDVGMDFIEAEGEGFESIEEWREDHRKFFLEEDNNFTDDSKVVCERFEYIELIGNKPGRMMGIVYGTIIENSLSDKGILDRMKILRKYSADNWILYDIEVRDDEILNIREAMADGPWYIHLWYPNEEDVIVIFKLQSFRIKYSDKSTWTDAIKYGKYIGIPEEQLDFLISF